MSASIKEMQCHLPMIRQYIKYGSTTTSVIMSKLTGLDVSPANVTNACIKHAITIPSKESVTETLVSELISLNN